MKKNIKKPLLYKLGDAILEVKKDFYLGGWNVWNEGCGIKFIGPFMTRKECIERIEEKGAIKL